MKWKFGLLFPFGQRLERDVKATSTKSKQSDIKNMKTWELIPYSDSICISFTHTTALISAPPGRTLGLLVCLMSTMRHLQGQRQIWQGICDIYTRTHIYTHTDRHLGQTRHVKSYLYCMFLPEHTQQCWIPLPCKPFDWPKWAQSALTSNPVSPKPGITLTAENVFKNSRHPLCRQIVGKTMQLNGQGSSL